MKLPAFLKQINNTLVYNGDGEFVFYVPESYFTDVKANPIAQIIGSYVSLIGVLDWAIVTKNGSVGKANPFKFPTIFMCKPYEIEKVKDLVLNDVKSKDYRILHFKSGDEVISDINVPQVIDNVETLFRMMVVTGSKIPQTVRYDKMQDYFTENMELNGNSYGINMQMFGIMLSELCRDPNDMSRPFRYTSMEDMNNYKQVSVKAIPNYISPYVALTSENWDESLMSAILIDNDKDIKYSPLEKIVTG